MHWSAHHASKFARIAFAVVLVLLWQATPSTRGNFEIFKLPNQYAPDTSQSLMIPWTLLAMAGLLSLASIDGLLRSARIMRSEDTPAGHIKHAVGSDLALAIIGFGLTVASCVSHLEGMNGDTIFGAGVGAVIFAGIVGSYALHRASSRT